DRAGEIDCYHFHGHPGQEVGVQALVKGNGSKLDPVLRVTDAAGRVLAESTTGLLGYVCPAPGTYGLVIHDREYRGGKEFSYRLHIGKLPIITSAFPLGLQRGHEIEVRVAGVNLSGLRFTTVKAAADAAAGQRIAPSMRQLGESVLGVPNLVVGE